MMFMADNQIKTSIDSLVELLNTKGKMDVNGIAVELGVPAAVIENWAKVLEKGEMAKIAYELGKMYVMPAAPGQDTHEFENRLNVQKEVLNTELDSGILELQRFDETLENLRATALTANKVYSERMPDMQNKLSELNKIYGQMKHENDAILGMRDNLEKVYESINKKLADMLSKINYIDSSTVGGPFDSSVKKTEEVLGEFKKFDYSVHDMRSKKNKEISGIRAEMNAQIRKLRQELEVQSRDISGKIQGYQGEIEKTNQQMKEQSDVARSLLKQIGEFKMEKEKEKKLLDESVKEFSDRYAKSYDIMSKGIANMNANSKVLIDGIENIKSGFGDASKIYDILHEVQAETERLEKRIADEKKSIQDLKQELAAVGTGNLSQQQKAVKLAKVAEKSANIEKNLMDINVKVDDNVKKLGLGGKKSSGKKSK